MEAITILPKTKLVLLICKHGGFHGINRDTVLGNESIPGSDIIDVSVGSSQPGLLGQIESDVSNATGGQTPEVLPEFIVAGENLVATALKVKSHEGKPKFLLDIGG